MTGSPNSANSEPVEQVGEELPAEPDFQLNAGERKLILFTFGTFVITVCVLVLVVANGHSL